MTKESPKDKKVFEPTATAGISTAVLAYCNYAVTDPELMKLITSLTPIAVGGFVWIVGFLWLLFGGRSKEDIAIESEIKHIIKRTRKEIKSTEKEIARAKKLGLSSTGYEASRESLITDLTKAQLALTQFKIKDEVSVS